MAGSLIVKTEITLAGIATESNVPNTAALATAPIEYKKGRTVLSGAPSSAAVALLANVTDIPLANVFGVYIKAEVGTIYITLQEDGTVYTTCTAIAADMILLVGEDVYIPYNCGKTGVKGIQVNGSAATAEFSYIILGKA